VSTMAPCLGRVNFSMGVITMIKLSLAFLILSLSMALVVGRLLDDGEEN
jgi:hypothetical protein